MPPCYPTGPIGAGMKVMGSLGFRRVTVLESPTCWGVPRHTPNKLETPARYPCQLPKTQVM